MSGEVCKPALAAMLIATAALPPVAAVARSAPPAPASPAPAQAPASPVAGSWTGPFVGSVFTFELKPAPSGWTGRYRSEKSGKWADLQDVSVADGTVRFRFESQPPSAFVLKIDPAGRTLSGSATFGNHPALPLTLTRAS